MFPRSLLVVVVVQVQITLVEEEPEVLSYLQL
jgi:hypothetical protein